MYINQICLGMTNGQDSLARGQGDPQLKISLPVVRFGFIHGRPKGLHCSPDQPSPFPLPCCGHSTCPLTSVPCCSIGQVTELTVSVDPLLKVFCAQSCTVGQMMRRKPILTVTLKGGGQGVGVAGR